MRQIETKGMMEQFQAHLNNTLIPQHYYKIFFLST